MDSGNCSFTVIRKINQRSPICSPKQKIKMVGSGKTIPDRDAEEIGVPARRFLNKANSFVVILDDLEKSREDSFQGVFCRYRMALDTMLGTPIRRRAAVHFLVFMIEAYYFADSKAVNSIFKTNLNDFDGDVEIISNPKSKLKNLAENFDEIKHGQQIVEHLDLRHILSNPEHCASLRSLFKWCATAIGSKMTDEFQLAEGKCCPITAVQIEDLRHPDSPEK